MKIPAARRIHTGSRHPDVGPWTLDIGPWTLDIGPWTLDIGPWTFLFNRIDEIRQQPIGSALQIWPVRGNRQPGHHVQFKVNSQ